ncbi:MAG TPA: ferrous iron transport protein A [Leptolyngbyaceae cyanobacterium M65_K2018_010]|nr:ferrous iron transport protein A [Leptolyngbyaceae cyanobacterium M65_K2018_010]
MAPTHHPLSALRPGHSATIAHLDTDPGLHQRLLALGFRQGRSVKMLRKSRFAGPVHVRVGTTEVMMRRREAHNIHIAPWDSSSVEVGATR